MIFVYRRAVICIVCCLGFTGCNKSALQKPEVAIAAAANLAAVFQIIGPRFEARTGIHPVFSFASTAQLAHQIENAAPFDVFTAADSKHVQELQQKGLLAPGSRAIYARGVLALWIPPQRHAPVNELADLAKSEVRFIAIAKPELAPYGQAAVESLQRLGIWPQLQGKIVYSENISAAKQYGASGNADAVFTAYSLVMREAGRVIRMDEKLHQPIDQELGIVANSKRPVLARKFVDFLLAGEGRDILRDHGYQIPESPTTSSVPH